MTTTDNLPPVTVRSTKVETLDDFFAYNGYSATSDAKQPRLLRVKATEDSPEVWMVQGDQGLHFEAYVGTVAELVAQYGPDEATLLRDLLQLNASILPVSLAINENNEVLIVESRERENLDSNELAAVFDAIEIAYTRLEQLLTTTTT